MSIPSSILNNLVFIPVKNDDELEGVTDYDDGIGYGLDVVLMFGEDDGTDIGMLTSLEYQEHYTKLLEKVRNED
jgi:hypothetical protein